MPPAIATMTSATAIVGRSTGQQRRASLTIVWCADAASGDAALEGTPAKLVVVLATIWPA
jgi:hypothetical protein